MLLRGMQVKLQPTQVGHTVMRRLHRAMYLMRRMKQALQAQALQCQRITQLRQKHQQKLQRLKLRQQQGQRATQQHMQVRLRHISQQQRWLRLRQNHIKPGSELCRICGSGFRYIIRRAWSSHIRYRHSRYS